MVRASSDAIAAVDFTSPFYHFPGSHLRPDGHVPVGRARGPSGQALPRAKSAIYSSMYSVADYGLMAACGARMDAYARALERTVKPDSVVLDLGAGTGIFSLIAARAGARIVHAVDPNPAIWLLPELAAENGLADRIRIHPISSLDLQLAEKADVIVSDLRGAVPLNEDHLAALHDAKRRLLADGGVLLPARDRLFVALVEARQLSATLERASEGFERHGFRATAARASISNSAANDWPDVLHANDVLSTAETWATIEYGETRGSTEGTVQLGTRRRGTARGLAIWFEATIHEDLGYSNAPGNVLVYSRCFLPLSRPVELAEGDRARVVLRVDERGQRWAWETEVRSAAGVTKASFRQSTFFGAPTSPDALLRGASTFTPSISSKGERLRRLLDMMNGSRSIEELARELGSSEPNVRPEALLEEVRDAASRYAD